MPIPVNITLTSGRRRAAAFVPSDPPGYVSASHDVAALRAAGSLWQNPGKTTPAVAAADPVRVGVAASGVEWSAASDAASPALTNSGQKWWIQGDGVNDLFTYTGTLGVVDSAGYALGLVAATPNWAGGSQNFTLRLRDNSTGNLFVVYTQTTGALTVSVNDSTVTAQAGINTSWFTLLYRRSGTGYSLSVNGGAPITGNVATTARSANYIETVGANGVPRGAVAGLFLYTSDLSTENATALQTYMTAIKP